MFASQAVGIVGAGPAGLAAARALKDAGIPFEVLERHSAPGGIWDLDNPGTPMYESAHFISSKTLSGFRDTPFGDDLPDYPRRDQVLDYLRAYAEPVTGHVTFNAEVVRARPHDSGWTLTLANGETRAYRHLVAANGHQWTPRVPVYPGGFAGHAIHSCDYREPSLFAGKRVLVVGCGNSGVDIACDAAATARSTVLSMRRGYWFIPKHMFGKPSDVFAHGGPRLPLRLEQAVLGGLLRLLVGDLRNFGLRKPDHRILESHPIMNVQVLHHLSHGDLTAKPDIASLDGDSVTFSDRTSGEFDLVVWATGYDASVPFVDLEVDDLYLGQFHRDREDFSVMGRFEVDGGAYPILSLQADLLVKALTDGLDRSGRPDLSGGTRHVDSERHHISIQDAAYQRHVKKVLSRS